MASINFLAVALCTFMNMVLGGLWYSPFLFGTTWIKLMKLNRSETNTDPTIANNARKGYIFSTVCHLIMSIVMAHFIQYTHASGSWFDGLKVGFICWLGFTLTTMLPNQIFSKNDFSWLLAAINIAYPMVGLSAAGALLAAWQ